MSKYNNIKASIDGIKFDSKKEAARYCELRILQKTGAISGLKLQPHFTLQEAFVTADGEKIKAITYIADFSYIEDGKAIVEDVKGVKTDVYKLKKKLIADKFGVHIRET